MAINMHELLCGEIQRMSHIERYSSYPMIRRENVAEHSWYVTFYSWAIAYDISMNARWDNDRVDVNLEDVMRQAFLHDIDECVMGDVVITTKHEVPGLKETIQAAATERVDKVSMDIFGHFALGNIWQGTKDSTLEGQIAQLADYMSVASYILQEKRFGNTIATRICKELTDRINKWWMGLSGKISKVLGPYVGGILKEIEVTI